MQIVPQAWAGSARPGLIVEAKTRGDCLRNQCGIVDRRQLHQPEASRVASSNIAAPAGRVGSCRSRPAPVRVSSRVAPRRRFTSGHFGALAR